MRAKLLTDQVHRLGTGDHQPKESRPPLIPLGVVVGAWSLPQAAEGTRLGHSMGRM